MKNVVTILKDGSYFAEIDGGARFFVGKRVQYHGRKGLMNVVGSASDRYNNSVYNNGGEDLWGDIIYPTAAVEGSFFHTLNTYDRARFTFGFLQYATHVPNGDFVKYFRTLLGLSDAAEYFPDLKVVGNRIVKITETGSVQLENDASTEALMSYFNPTSENIEDTEVIQSAKLVEWSKKREHRDLQVGLGKSLFKESMAQYDRSFGLNNRRIDVCIVVADILHQGRGGGSEIRRALAAANPFNELLEIGSDQYEERVRGLRTEIEKLMDNPAFASKKYNREIKDFK